MRFMQFLVVCYVGIFGNLGGPVVPTLRVASGVVVTAYAFEDTKESLALPKAGQGPCEGCEILISTNNGSLVCMEWCGSRPKAAQKSKFPKLVFF